MKQIRYMIAAVLLSGIVVLGSCTKKSDPEPVDQAPSITFVPGTGFVSSDVTLKINSPFKVRISAASNSTSRSPLKKFTITWVHNSDRITVLDTVINMNTLNTDVSAQAYSQAGQERWYFKVTDQQNYSSEIGFAITTTATGSNKPNGNAWDGTTATGIPRVKCSIAPAEQ